MKSMPGMNNIQQLFSQMGLSGLGGVNGGGKLNTNAMEAQLNRNLKTAKMKERMKNKIEKKNKNNNNLQQENIEKNINEKNKGLSDEEIIKMFSTNQTNKSKK